MFENENKLERLNWGCAVVLTDKSKSLLAEKLSDFYEMYFDTMKWKKFAHHMTVAFGKGLESFGLEADEGKEVELKVLSFGFNKFVCAIKVEGYATTNETPHITIGVNIDEGGKPVMSNQIDNWEKGTWINPSPESISEGAKPLILTGVVTEMKQKK